MNYYEKLLKQKNNQISNFKEEKGYYAKLVEKKNEMIRPNMFIIDHKSYNIAEVAGFKAAGRAIQEKYDEMVKKAETPLDIEMAKKWQKEMGEMLLKASLRDR